MRRTRVLSWAHVREWDGTEPLHPTPGGRAQAAADQGAEGERLAPGARVASYVIERELAQGSFGTVYLARHGVLERRVAIKVLHRDLAGSAEIVERFVREARAVNRIRHPHIVDIHDFGSLPDGRPYHVMEMLDGDSLASFLAARGRLDEAELLALFEPLCQALQAAHDAGVVHRDLKAGNIMVGTSPLAGTLAGPGAEPGAESATARPAIAWVKLLDFGVAKLLSADRSGWLTSQGRVLGTPQTMAPEQILGRAVDHRADIYALGVLLFQALTGRPPFTAREAGLVEQQHLSVAPPRPSLAAPVSPALDAVVLRAMAKQPDQRFPSALSLWQALREAAGAGEARPERAYPAVAVHVEASLCAHGTVDEQLLEDLGDMLDEVADALRRAGLVIALETRSAVLGVALAADGALAGPCRQVLAVAREIAAMLEKHAAADAALGFSACVHAGPVLARCARARADVDADIVGGDLVDLQSWPQSWPQRWPPDGDGPRDICRVGATAEVVRHAGDEPGIGRVILVS